MKWVLLIYINLDGGASQVSAEYYTLEACKSAFKSHSTRVIKSHGLHPSRIIGTCTPYSLPTSK